MSTINVAKAAILAIAVAATPVLAETPADAASQQVRVLLKHEAALKADVLQVQVVGQTVYIRGAVDSQLESNEVDSVATAIPGAHVVNATIVTGAGS